VVLSGKEMGKGTKQTSQTAIEKKGMVIKEGTVQITITLGFSRETESIGYVCVYAHMYVYVYTCMCIRERE